MMRPVLARTNSAASGLRFCGMIEEPVVNLSDSLRKPTSGEVQITISSAKRDRCTEAMRRRGERFQHEIAVGHRIERVRGRPVEAERLGGHGAVERKRGAGQRRGAQRAFIAAPAGVGEAAAVAGGHFHIGEQVMAEGHGLGGLQVGEARHHRSGMGQRLLGKRALVGGQARIEPVDGVAHPQPEVGRDLVVARARGVQPPGRRPDQLGEPRLDVHMDVFQRPLELEPAALHLRQDRVQAGNDRLGVGRRNNALMSQHLGVGPACRDVLAKQLAVDVDRGIYVRHDGVGLRAEPAAPHLVAHDRLLLMTDPWL